MKRIVISIIILLAVVIIICVAFLIKNPEVIKEIGKGLAGKETTTTTITVTTTTIPNQTGNATTQIENQTNATVPGGQPTQQQAKNVSEKIPPEITNLCLSKPSAAASNQTQIITSSKGMVYCLNQKYPYYLAMELNNSNLTTWVYDYPETVENFNLSYEKTLYYLFVGDVSDMKIENFYMTGNASSYFSIGDYTEYTIQKMEDGILKEELVAILPFDANNETINKTEGWEEIKFYLKTTLKDFYLGNLFVEIK